MYKNEDHGMRITMAYNPGTNCIAVVSTECDCTR